MKKALMILYPLVSGVAGIVMVVHAFIARSMDSLFLGMLLIHMAAIFVVHEILGEPYPWEQA